MIIINIIFLIFFITLYYLTRIYDKEFLTDINEKEHPLKFLYPLSLYITDRFMSSKLWRKGKSNGKSSGRTIEHLKELYVGESIEIVSRLYQCKKIAFGLFILFLFNLLSLFTSIKDYKTNILMDGNYLIRPNYNEGSTIVNLDAYVKEEEGFIKNEVEVELIEKNYSDDEIEKLFEDIINSLDTDILGNNKSLDEVSHNLNFLQVVPGTSILIIWSTSENIIDKTGEIYNENLDSNSLILISATITYEEKSVEYSRYVKVLPIVYTKEELLKLRLNNLLNEIININLKEERVYLPDEVEGKSITWKEEKNQNGIYVLILGVVATILVTLSAENDLKGKVEKRRSQMLLDYPEIISKFNLLVSAGMSITNTWNKIVSDYMENNKEKRFAYEEMAITAKELSLGESEIVAIERFGRRIKLQPYLRFSSLIGQNVKKGTSGLLQQLEVEAVDAFYERKELVKRLGEEAGTKLLIPMVIMLFLVLVIIMVPAFMSFQF
jgi:tight adherence protein C